MLQSFNTGGFAMTFENGLTLTVAFGANNKGSNNGRNSYHLFTIPNKEAHAAEIFISDQSSEYYSFPLDGKKSQGYVNADGVAEWIKAVQKATSLKDIVEPENVGINILN